MRLLNNQDKVLCTKSMQKIDLIRCWSLFFIRSQSYMVPGAHTFITVKSYLTSYLIE